MTLSGWFMMLIFVGGAVLLFLFSIGKVFKAEKEDSQQASPDSDSEDSLNQGG